MENRWVVVIEVTKELICVGKILYWAIQEVERIRKGPRLIAH